MATANSESPRYSSESGSEDTYRSSEEMKRISTSAASNAQVGTRGSTVMPSATVWARVTSDSSRVVCICIRAVMKAEKATDATAIPTAMVVSRMTRLASDRR